MFVVVVLCLSSLHLLFSLACDSLWSYLTAGQILYKILKHNDGCISEGPEEIKIKSDVIRQESYDMRKGAHG